MSMSKSLEADLKIAFGAHRAELFTQVSTSDAIPRSNFDHCLVLKGKDRCVVLERGREAKKLQEWRRPRANVGRTY